MILKIQNKESINLEKNLFPKSAENEEANSFISAILHAIRFQKEQKTDICNLDDLKEITDENVIKCILDLQKINNNCYEINCFLSNHNLFLRIFELRSKFRYFTLKESKKQSIVRQISSCITEKYSGFQTIVIEFARKTRKIFKPIDIFYKPTKNPEKSLLVITAMIFLKHIVILTVLVIQKI